jgi:mannosyl-oligosaccharide alpha-1,2-mannosidase
MKKSMKNTLQRAIIWLGSVFIAWHIISLLFSSGSSKPSRPSFDTQSQSPKLSGDAQRAAAIVDAFRFSWDKYEKYAAPHDTLLPVSKKYEDDRYVRCELKRSAS